MISSLSFINQHKEGLAKYIIGVFNIPSHSKREQQSKMPYQHCGRDFTV
jgi:hypothetical protein